jgi:AraC family transcriptional regulator
MLLNEFPNLSWLKTQIDQRFQQRRAFNNLPLDSAGFPSVIINAQTKEQYRPDVIGPISLFLNLQGNSYCSTDGRKVCVTEDHFFISNRFQPYTLEIESRQSVETFNIHFGEHFSEGVLGALLTPADKILNDGLQQAVHTVAFYNRLYHRDEQFNNLVTSLQQTKHSTLFDKLHFEELLANLLTHLLYQHRDILQQVDKMPPVKNSTRIELYKRLSFALDYIHTAPSFSIELDELAATACLSKYHFLRLFKLVFGITPHQYIQQLRLKKARQLLKCSSLPIQEVSDQLGFENSQSFSRLFFQHMGMYPTQYRA